MQLFQSLTRLLCSFSPIKNRVFRRKALTISTHRTSFSRFWRSIFLQLLVINRFIDEYAICMYACFARMIYIATYCPSQQQERTKKKEEENALFFIYATVHAVHARENWIQKSRAEEHEEKVIRFISRARTTHERHDYYYYVHAVVFATRGFEYPDRTDEIFQNHSLHASTTTLPSYALTTRIYTHVHLHAHTRAIRCRSEMFDLLHTFLAQRQKKGLVSTDFQLCLQEEGIFGSLLHYVDYMEKWELYIQTVFVFYSSRKDKLSYGGFKMYIQEQKDKRQKLDTGIFFTPE